MVSATVISDEILCELLYPGEFGNVFQNAITDPEVTALLEDLTILLSTDNSIAPLPVKSKELVGFISGSRLSIIRSDESTTVFASAFPIAKTIRDFLLGKIRVEILYNQKKVIRLVEYALERKGDSLPPEEYSILKSFSFILLEPSNFVEVPVKYSETLHKFFYPFVDVSPGNHEDFAKFSSDLSLTAAIISLLWKRYRIEIWYCKCCDAMIPRIVNNT